MKKRILSILLTLCMLLCFVPTAVQAAEGDKDITEVNLLGVSNELWSHTDVTFAAVDDSADYTIVSQKWFSSTAAEIKPDSANLKPKPRADYTFTITLEAKDGYVFPIKSESAVFYDGTVRLDGTEYDGGVITVSSDCKMLTAIMFPLTTAKGVASQEVNAGTEDELAAALSDTSIDMIRLNSDINLTAWNSSTTGGFYVHCAITRKVTLDLNGYVLKGTGANSRIGVFEVTDGGDLTIIDSRPDVEHKFTTDNDGLWVLDEQNGDKTVNGGIITGGKTNGGGVEVCEGGRFTMTGGSIVGCVSENLNSSGGGGGVYIRNSGTFTMSGGGIIGCVAQDSGGGVFFYKNGTFTMTGGVIRNCTANGDGGDALYLYGGTMNACGGTVDGTVVVDEAYDSASSGNIPGVIRGAADSIGATEFKQDVTNVGEIRHGDFSGKVTGSSGSVISGGIFNGEVVNEMGTINDGTFNGKLTSNGGTINNGTFNGVVDLFRCPTGNDSFSNVIVNGGSFTETSTVNNIGCTIYNGAYSGKVSVVGWLEPPDGYGTTGVIMGGTFTETSEVTSLTTSYRNLVGIICGGDFYGKVKLEGGIIDNFGSKTMPIFHESSEVYFTSGIASGGIYYGTEIYGDANVSGGAYCTLVFKTRGGSEVPEQKVLRGKKAVPLSENPTKTGYIFSGWLRNGAPYDLAATPLIDHDVELTAVWSECDHSGNTAKPTCTEPAACSVCGGTIAAIGHDFSASVLQHDENTHWKKCSRCDAKNDENPHDWNSGTVTKPASCVAAGEKTYTCSECSFEKIDQIDAKGHNYGEEWQHDATHHWHSCSDCDTKESYDAHSGGIAACTSVAICKYCHQSYGEKDPTNHEGGTEQWTTRDADSHEKKWSCCGAVIVAGEAHEWADGVCSECGYVCADEDTDNDHICNHCGKVITDHTGGKATCKDKAVCEVCGESYGELDKNSHSDIKHTDAKAATKDSEGNIEYWHCEGCGRYFGDAAATKEIKKEDTVTGKLAEDKKPPKTGDSIALWLAVLFVSGGAVFETTVLIVKKKRSAK